MAEKKLSSFSDMATMLEDMEGVLQKMMMNMSRVRHGNDHYEYLTSMMENLDFLRESTEVIITNSSSNPFLVDKAVNVKNQVLHALDLVSSEMTALRGEYERVMCQQDFCKSDGVDIKFMSAAACAPIIKAEVDTVTLLEMAAALEKMEIVFKNMLIMIRDRHPAVDSHMQHGLKLILESVNFVIVNGSANPFLVDRAIDLKNEVVVACDIVSFKNVCRICQHHGFDDFDMKGAECGHDFHERCVNKWHESKGTCPVCPYVLMLID
ncbi:hypothetical protein Sjap_024135 [Stephania japonica]|uniref:RING-type domain-containing protein n=1 Tax=Stephania japonica TaxID=461633 RepID=A0AAP0HJL2_9MAGN